MSQYEFDARDAEIVADRMAMREARHRRVLPWEGDWLRFPNGEFRRAAYCWDDGVQPVSSVGDGGSFHLCANGHADMSGGLDSIIPNGCFRATDETRDADVWIFHHGSTGAHRGVHTKVPFRVFDVVGVERRTIPATAYTREHSYWQMPRGEG